MSSAIGIAMNERVQVFADGDFLSGTLTWGWQCFACCEEETGLGDATTARAGADNHVALCRGAAS